MNSLYQFAKANYNLNKLKNRMFSFVMAFCIFIVFQYFNFVYIPQIRITVQDYSIFGIDLSSIAMSGMSLCIVVIIMFVMAALCQSFLKQKTMEVAVLSLGGANISHVSRYLFLQLCFIMMRALPIGFLIFIGVNPIFNMMVKATLELNYSIFFVSMNGIGLSLVCLGLLLVTFIISATGYSYRNDLIHLLENLDQSKRTLPISQLKMPGIVYWLLFIGPIFSVGAFSGNSRGTITFLLIAAYGLSKLLKKSLGKVLLKVRMVFCQGRKETSIAIGRTTIMLHSACNNITMQFVAILGIITFLANNYNEAGLRLLLCFTLFIILLMVIFTFVYRNMEDDNKLIKQYQTIYHLGFSRKQLYRINRQELIFTFIINIIFILSYGITIIVTSQGIMPLLDGIILLGGAVGAFLIALIVVYLYRKRIIDHLKNGGLHNG